MSDDDAALSLGGALPAGLDGDVSAALVRQIAEQSPAVMVVAAMADLRIVYANRAAHRAARWEVGSATGALAGRVISDAFGFIDPALLVAGTQGGSEDRAVAERKGDATVWWDVSYVTLDTGPPETRGVLVTAVDVTHHELARAEARAAQDTLDALLAYIPEGISIAYGPEIHVDRISARGMSLLGREAGEVTGHSALRQSGVWDVYRPGSAVPLSPNDRPLARATRTGEVKVNETLIIRRPDGSLLTVACNSGPIRDGGGRVTGAVMAWHDVSELQRAQAAMRDSEERLSAVLLQIPAAVFIVEAPDGRVTFKSRMLDTVLGPPGGDMAEAKATLRGWAVHPDGSAYDLSEYPSRRALFRGETVRAEAMAFRRSDGRLIDLEMHAGPVRNEAGEIVAAVAVALDVTERNQAATRLRESEERLRMALEAREVLLREADHRIKNSLQLVGSLLALQRSRLSDPDVVAALDGAIARVMAVSEAHRALHQSVDLRHVALDEMLRDLSAHVGTLNPALTFLCDCPAALQLDTERAIPLGLVVSELLTNAAKYAYPSGSGEVRTTVRVAGGLFEIAVSDSGVGMRGEGGRRSRLGSTIVRALVAQIGAEIDVSSAPGEGTRTRLRFSQRA